MFEVYHLWGVEAGQYTGAAIMMSSGADGPLDKYNLISAGWFVSPFHLKEYVHSVCNNKELIHISNER